MNAEGPPAAPSSNSCLYASSNSVLLSWQAIIALVTSALLHFILKRLRQPRMVSEILAGLIIGSIQDVKDFIFPSSSYEALASVSMVAMQFYMFLVGLDMDPLSLLSTSPDSRSPYIAYASVATCSLLSIVAAPIVNTLSSSKLGHIPFSIFLTLFLSNTSSPVLARLLNDLKLLKSNVASVSLRAALLNDMMSLFFTFMIVSYVEFMGRNIWGESIPKYLVLLIGVAVATAFALTVIHAVGSAVSWLNDHNPDGKPMNPNHASLILFVVVVVCSGFEAIGFSSIVGSFFFGLLLPKEGRVSSMLLQSTSYVLYTFVMPVFLFTASVDANLKLVANTKALGLLGLVYVLAAGGKLVGTVTAAAAVDMPLHEGVAVGLLMNVKGPFHMMCFHFARRMNIISEEALTVMVLVVLLSVSTVCPIISLIVRRARRTAHFKWAGLEWHNPSSELRIMACLHSPRNVPAAISLLEASKGTPSSPLLVYAMHLLELTDRTAATIMFKVRADPTGHASAAAPTDEASIENDEIVQALDTYVGSTSGLTIRHLNAIASFSTMHEDIVNAAQDALVSLILLPFHKVQRVDGRMEEVAGSAGPGFQGVNRRVQRSAPCSVAILVDRGIGGATQLTAVHVSHHVAVLFFGGADDREALAFASRMAEHRGISIEVVHFIPMVEDEDNISIAGDADVEKVSEIAERERERRLDCEFLEDFHTRCIATGQVGYLERRVGNGAEMVEELRGMEEMYNLFVVGRGEGSRPSKLIEGMSDWDDCPELGPVGDFLASPDFSITASVLVMKQHARSATDEVDDDFEVVI
ncbi:hypothetical protein AMTRI_Chr02g220770 [Amborella trichopoda]